MKLKVCGMKYNASDVAALRPDYLGFIFWEPSSRFFDGDVPSLPPNIKKIGVFVDEKLEEVIRLITEYNLNGVQLHGNESPEYCRSLRHSELVSKSHSNETLNQVHGDELKIIKVFSIKNEFDFTILEAYEEICNYFLFDTKGKLPGGNGYTFDWSVLKKYPSTKPYFLSGGIGLENLEALNEFLKSPDSKYCHAIDVNSKFEDQPGLKNIEKLKELTRFMTNNCQLKTDD